MSVGKMNGVNYPIIAGVIMLALSSGIQLTTGKATTTITTGSNINNDIISPAEGLLHPDLRSGRTVRSVHSIVLDALTGSKLINLTINWTIENFLFLLEEPEVHSPSVSSLDAGLLDADGDWHLILTPTNNFLGKPYVSLHVERANATYGNVTGRFGFFVLDRKGMPIISLSDDTTNVFTVFAPENNWGYDKFIPHTSLLNPLPPTRKLLIDGKLIIQAKIEFLGTMTINGTVRPFPETL